MTRAQTSAALLRDYHRARGPWTQAVALDRDYYANKQWTTHERNELEKTGRAPLVINRIYPAVQQKLAQLTSHRPVIRATPKEEGDNKKSTLWSSVIEYVLQNSGFPLVDLEVKRDHIVAGVGYYYAYVDPYDDDGRGEVKVSCLPPDIVYVDPSSRKPDYSDADHIIVTQVYTLQQARNMFPDKIRQLNRAKDQLLEMKDYDGTSLHSEEGTITPADVEGLLLETDEGKIRIIERFSKKRVPYYIVTNPVDQSVYTVDQQEFNDLYKGNDNFSAIKIFRTNVERLVSAGEDVSLGSETLKIDIYPIIAVPNVHIGTPFPLSDVRYLRGLQDEVNKRRSLLIADAIANHSTKWLAEETAIPDEAKFRRQNAKIGGILTYRLLNDKSVPPQRLLPPPVASGVITLEAEAKHDIDSTIGIFPVSHGDPSGAPETFGGTLALEEYANRRLSPSIEIFNHGKQNLGKMIIVLAQSVYTLPKFIRIVGEDGTVEEVLLNDNGKQTFKGQEYEETKLDHKRYDVIIQSGRVAPTNRIAHEQKMVDLFDKGAIDQQTLIESMDLPNKEKILERSGVLSKQQGAIQALEEEVKKLEGQLQSRNRELMHAGVKAVVDESRIAEKSALLDFKDQLRELVQKGEITAHEFTTALRIAEQEARTSGNGAGEQKEKQDA